MSKLQISLRLSEDQTNQNGSIQRLSLQTLVMFLYIQVTMWTTMLL